MIEHQALETKVHGGDVGQAFEEFMRAFEAFKETNDERLAAIERRAADPLTEEKLARIDRTLDETKRIADDLVLKAARPRLGGAAPHAPAVREHKAAFETYVRSGDDGRLRELETKALSVGTGTDGGYLVPDEIERAVNRAVKDVSPIRAIAGVRQVSGSEAGEWEVVQFETATLVSLSTYELSGLLRGQGGSEEAMRSPLAAGARFVLISSAVTAINLTLDEIRLPFNWRFGPASRDIGDASYATLAHTFSGRGLRPLAPVHVRGRRTGGELAISWIRRTRTGGDGWDAAEVPLGEDSERYEVDVLDGGTVVRTLAATAASVTYSAAQQVEDFGAEQGAVSVKVYQLGTVYGRGGACSAVV